MIKKISITLGTISAIAIPIGMVISCGSPNNIKKKTDTKDNTVKDTKDNANKNEKDNITINMRVMEWSKQEDYDATKFDSSNEIQFWSWEHHKNEHKMMPFFIDSSWHINKTYANTFGEALDELNSKKVDFKYNIDDVEKAGKMGRMLYGVKKSDDYISKNNIGEHNQYWGIHEEFDKDTNDWKFTSTADYDYLSFTSPNSFYAVADSSQHFDKNESFYMFDNRLSRGLDTTQLFSNNIFNINTWKMI